MTPNPDCPQENVLHGLSQTLTIRLATQGDVDPVKALADREKRALGFVHRGSLERSVARDELIVAADSSSIIGFCQLYRRRDGRATIHHVAVKSEARRTGVGSALIRGVVRDAVAREMHAVRLKCPADLPANAFYARIGFSLVGVEAHGKRPLNVWEWELPEQPAEFDSRLSEE